MLINLFIFIFGIWILANDSHAEEVKQVKTDDYANELRQWLKNKPPVNTVTTASGHSFRDCPECPEMVNIPAGNFMMGSANGKSDEKPIHRVDIRAFALGKYEITLKEFQCFVETTSYKIETEKNSECYNWIKTGWEKKSEFTWRNAAFQQTEKHPVVCVNWHDAIAYTQWLSQKTGKNYRLPTEAEWEYAARAGTTTDYWWGDTISHENANYGLDSYCCRGLAQGRDQWEFTAPVGSFSANPFDLYDTAGNVWEWTCSGYESYYRGSELKCDMEKEGNRVLRGGSWSNQADRLRSATRGGSELMIRSNALGFRVAVTIGR
jgi:formylglycine-generating enzyme required for sulfatase activity